MFDDFSINKQIKGIEQGKNTQKADKLNFEVENTSIFSGINHIDDLPENITILSDISPFESDKEKYKEHVDTQDVIDALFYLENSKASFKDKKQIDEQIQNTVKNAKTFQDVDIKSISYTENYDGITERPVNQLPGSLNAEDTKQYLNSEKGKEALKEIGIEEFKQSFNGKTYGETYYRYNNQIVDINVSADGTLRIGYSRPIFDSHYDSSNIPDTEFCGHKSKRQYNIADFKLRDEFKPNAENTKYSEKLYNDKPDFQDSFSVYFQDKKTNVPEKINNAINSAVPDAEIYKDGISTLLLDSNENKNGEIEQKLKNASGIELKNMKFKDNYIYFEEKGVKDFSSTEHRFYYDKKSGEFVRADVTSGLKNRSNIFYDIDIYKPNKNNTPVSNESETINKYSISGTDIELAKHLKEKGIETDIFPDTIQTLIRKTEGRMVLNDEFSNTRIGKQLEALTGKKMSELHLHGNQAHYTDDKGVEHQFYYDKKSGEFINANVVKNDNGGYDVEIKSTGKKALSLQKEEYKPKYKDKMELISQGKTVKEIFGDEIKSSDMNNALYTKRRHGN